MFVMRSRCPLRPVLPACIGHRSRPLDARRRRWIRRAVPPSVYVPDAYSAVSSTPSDTLPLALFVASGLGLALLIGFGLSPSLRGKGNVVNVLPSRLEALTEEKQTSFVDIRSRNQIKEIGNPIFKNKSVRRKTLPFLKGTKDGDVLDPKFGENFAKMRWLKTDSVLVVMDADGKLSNQAAGAILEFSDLKEVYVVSGGASALKASGWEWKDTKETTPMSLPKVSMPKISVPKVSVPKVSAPKVSVKAFDLDKVAETYKERPTLINTGLAFGALVTAGVVLFNEFDIILETVGLFGGVNVFFKRFFYAEDREKTIGDLRSLFDDKIKAGEAGDDLKQLAATILEDPPESIEAEQTPAASTDTVTDQVADTV